MKKRELDEMLDKVTSGINSERINDNLVSEAKKRVWTQLANGAATKNVASGSLQASAAISDHIEGCADFQSLIPAYLNGKLSEARSLLLVDHTHECIPCRRALKQARSGRVETVTPVRRQQTRPGYSLRPVVLRWGIAAALVIGLGLIALPLVQRYVPIGGLDATVQAADGPLYVVGDSQTRQLKVGEKIGHDEVLRTAKDSRAVVRLGDGSVIEMKDRSEFSISKTMRGTTVHLAGGSVIVEAAKQQPQKRTVIGKLTKEIKRFLGYQEAGPFYVDTGDSLVSVTGTTFSVNAGTKGSRVSVIEGEVHLDAAGQDKVLRAGEQATTNIAIDRIPVKTEVSWSRNAARYAQVLDGLAALNKDLNAVSKPGVRNSTRLLDLMPENTVIYAALPNLSDTIAESNRIIEERIQQNPALREWFASRREARGPGMNQAITTIKEFGDQLGDEIAVGAGLNDQGQPSEPVVLAQLKNAGGFRAFVDSEIQKLAAGGKAPQVQWIDDPRSAVGLAATDRQLYVWINGDIMVASPKLEGLQAIARGGSNFSSTPFYARIAGVYQEGAGIVVAADLERIIAHTRGVRRLAMGDQHEQALSQLGVFNMKSFVLDQKDSNGKTHTRAVLAYDQADHGITSWLAQPAPMRSLEYISPDANIVAGFVVKNPTAVVDDLLVVIGKVSPDMNKHLEDLQKNHGLDLRSDFAAPLGGEYAFAIDGPILPTPSWKLVFQVNDPVHLQQTFERVVEEINKQAAKDGKQGLALDRSELNGRTFYTLRSKDFAAMEVNYVLTDGFMIAGPTRALVDQAIRFRESGKTLLHSPQFMAGLPADGNVNFSALVYHNLAPLAQPLANRMGNANLPSGPQEAITMAATLEPTLAYAYAYGDHVEVAANTDGGPFGLSPATLLGMPNAFELHHILEQGMKKK